MASVYRIERLAGLMLKDYQDLKDSILDYQWADRLGTGACFDCFAGLGIEVELSDAGISRFEGKMIAAHGTKNSSRRGRNSVCRS
jgi:hypothetical protein